MSVLTWDFFHRLHSVFLRPTANTANSAAPHDGHWAASCSVVARSKLRFGAGKSCAESCGNHVQPLHFLTTTVLAYTDADTETDTDADTRTHAGAHSSLFVWFALA